MERNLRLYPWYQALRNLLFWLPVFFLYFGRHVPADRVLVLEAVYYAAVLALEVPSGYLSDRMGRRPTLILGMASWVGAGIVLATSSSFGAFAFGQVLMAAGMAFNSGTDTALLYDSLQSLGREREYATRAGRAQALALLGLAGSSIVGGLLAGFDLRLAYLLSALAAAGALAIAFRIEEPLRTEAAASPLRQLRAVVGRVGDPVLAWVLAFSLVLFIASHLPYELLQPWMRLLLGADESGWDPTPGAAGLMIASMMVLAATAAARAGAWHRRHGIAPVLLLLLVVQVLVLLALGVVSAWVIPLLLLRAVPQSVAAPIAEAAIHPRLDSSERATFLSLVSLVGRGSFALVLAAVATRVGPMESLEPQAMADVARIAATATTGALVLLWLASRALRPQF